MVGDRSEKGERERGRVRDQEKEKREYRDIKGE